MAQQPDRIEKYKKTQSSTADGAEKTARPSGAWLQVLKKLLILLGKLASRFLKFLLYETSKLKRRKDEPFHEYLCRMRVCAFMTVLILFGVIGLCIFARPRYSAVEKRQLTAFPSLSADALWDGSYFNAVDTWYSDTYPMREAMLKAQSGLEDKYGIRTAAIYSNTAATTVGDEIPTVDSGSTAKAPVIQDTSSGHTASGDSGSSTGGTLAGFPDSGNTSSAAAEGAENVREESTETNTVEGAGAITNTPEVAGTVYVADGYAFELYYFNKEAADNYSSMINTVKDDVGDLANIYVMIIPSSAGINLSENVQESVNSGNQNNAINYMYSRMDDSVTTINIYNQLRKHNNEYLYFHTDHHWTQLGAYYAYQKFCEVRGFQAHALDDYEECVYPGFLGTLYAASGQSPELAANEDTVYAYKPIATNDETMTNQDGQTLTWNIISDAADYGTGDKYMCFIGGDQPFIEIDNPDINDGSSCILIKESFGNAFAPFLVDHYDKVYVIDYRYYTGNLTTLVKAHPGTDIIFANNTIILELSTVSDEMRNMFTKAGSGYVVATVGGSSSGREAATEEVSEAPD